MMKRIIVCLALVALLFPAVVRAATRTVTVKDSGGDYTTLNAAFAGEYASWPNLTVNNGSGSAGILVFDHQRAAADDTTAAATGAGWGVNASYYLSVTGSASMKHAGVLDTSKCGIAVTSGIPFNAGVQYTRVTDMQFTITAGTGASCINFPQNCKAERCLTKTSYRTGITANGSTLKNCIHFGGPRYGIFSTSDSTAIYNCTVYGCSGASYPGIFLNAANNTVVSNCVSTNNAGDDFSLTNVAVVSNNASEDATADDFGGAGHLVNQTIANLFVDAAGGNFAVKVGSSLIDAGTATGAPTDDVLAATRTATPDIGAFEYLTAGGGGLLWLPAVLRNQEAGQ